MSAKGVITLLEWPATMKPLVGIHNVGFGFEHILDFNRCCAYRVWEYTLMLLIAVVLTLTRRHNLA